MSLKFMYLVLFLLMNVTDKVGKDGPNGIFFFFLVPMGSLLKSVDSRLIYLT